MSSYRVLKLKRRRVVMLHRVSVRKGNHDDAAHVIKLDIMLVRAKRY